MNKQRIHRRTSESRAFAERVQVVMELTSRLNLLPFTDLTTRTALLEEISLRLIRQQAGH
jgi:hypothetical protein